MRRRRSRVWSTGRLLIAVLPLAAAMVAVTAPPAWAFPTTADPGSGDLPCLPTDMFCLAGQGAGAVVTSVWISAMLALWNAGLWLLGLAFSVIDALTTPDLSADGPLAGVYPLTFAIGAAIAGVMAMVQVG